MKRQKKQIKTQEARMLQVLYKVPRSLTISELAHKSNISWVTANTYLKKWQKKGLVKSIDKKVYSYTHKKTIMRPEWEINRDIISKIRMRTTESL